MLSDVLFETSLETQGLLTCSARPLLPTAVPEARLQAPGSLQTLGADTPGSSAPPAFAPQHPETRGSGTQAL